MNLKTIVIFVCNIIYFIASEKITFAPTWESLDKRPLPQWYDEAKIGIFLHWGVYSVPSFGYGDHSNSEWFWANWKNGDPQHKEFMEKNYRPQFSYQEFANEFKAELYDPVAWAQLFSKSGAKYVVLTSKHHDGYTLWPSTYSFNWNVEDVGPRQDVLGELARAIRETTDLKFGVYYSLYEWFHPLYISDKESNFENNTFATIKMHPEMLELVEKYKPEVVWADGDWDATDNYWKSREFLTWLYNESPVKNTVVVNDRWGSEALCNHGDFYTCKDRFNPGVLQSHKWENAMSIDKASWGYRRVANITDYLTIQELLHVMVETVSCGGNILINVGPTSDGRISTIFQERLLELGHWLSINGEAIYNTKPWKYKNDSMSTTWYTSNKSILYAITLEWPTENILELGSVSDLFNKDKTVVTLLADPNHAPLFWRVVDDTTYVKLPENYKLLHDHAWVLKITQKMSSDSTGKSNKSEGKKHNN